MTFEGNDTAIRTTPESSITIKNSVFTKNKIAIDIPTTEPSKQPVKPSPADEHPVGVIPKAVNR